MTRRVCYRVSEKWASTVLVSCLYDLGIKATSPHVTLEQTDNNENRALVLVLKTK